MLIPAILSNRVLTITFGLPLCHSRKYPYSPPHGRFFVLHPFTPQKIPVELHTFLLKVWLLQPPSSLKFPMAFLGGSMNTFWNLTFMQRHLYPFKWYYNSMTDRAPLIGPYSKIFCHWILQLKGCVQEPRKWLFRPIFFHVQMSSSFACGLPLQRKTYPLFKIAGFSLIFHK